ncbi:hypothetical protein HanRHA438_Chr03g0131581 [Helianthus annuus]|nr:hypothetical protein HanIR_Chr03g0130601 [Helianthus annuus]KAJ0936466.1 hypothetical protein HanRHA438_Chr03g0131581 [Helianthus annuus]
MKGVIWLRVRYDDCRIASLLLAEVSVKLVGERDGGRRRERALVKEWINLSDESPEGEELEERTVAIWWAVVKSEREMERAQANRS